MILTYGGFDITNLGDVSISQERQYEGGDSPQRVKVLLRVSIHVFQGTFADNYSLIVKLRTALAEQHDTLLWQNEESNETYVNQPAVVVSNDLPEDPNGWGTYYQQCNLVFSYYEALTNPNNIPVVVQRLGDTTGNLTLTNVMEWKEETDTERFSPLHSGRKMVQRKITVSGMVFADPTEDLADQRTFLQEQKVALDELDGVQCLITFGNFFSQSVRIESFSTELDQAVNQIKYAFTGYFTRFPDEVDGYSWAEFTADQREAFTGELFLDINGKITASDETTARAALATLTTALLSQYQYSAAQPLKVETSANQVNPAGTDPDMFTELTFNLSYRKWRTDNQDATFKPAGASTPVSLSNVRVWTLEYNAQRFSQQRSQRQYAGGRIEASGTIPGDPTQTVATRRTALLAAANTLNAAVNSADGTLTRGTFNQVVRIENFRAEVNQALTGIDWNLQAIYSNFPNDTGYATVEFNVVQRDSVEDGEQFLVFSGRIWATDEATARSKLASVRTTVLSTYGFNIAQQIRQENNVQNVFANGDKTSGIATEMADGTTFIELTWNEEYRERLPGLLNWNLKITTRQDIPSGLQYTTYAGTVQATGPTVDVAYQNALAQAQTLGANKETAIGNNAFLRNSMVTEDTRQTQQTNPAEFVRLEFSYEYQSQLGDSFAFLEVSMELVTDAFGPDMQNVNGYIVTGDFAAAESLYASIRTLYNGQLVRNERTNETQVQNQNADESFTQQQLRLDFGFQVFTPKLSGSVAYKYGISTSKDFLSLQLNTRIHGSVFADSLASAQAALATLVASQAGSLLRDDQEVDHEFTSDSADFFIKLDFDKTYTAALTGITDLLEMTVIEEVNYSGPRWIVQPTLKASDGSGGYSVLQNLSVKEGNRTVRGTVSAASLATAQAWAKLNRVMLTGDKNNNSYPQPEQWVTSYEFVPRIQGIANALVATEVGGSTTPNARIAKVEFVFAEILPNYPAPT